MKTLRIITLVAVDFSRFWLEYHFKAVVPTFYHKMAVYALLIRGLNNEYAANHKDDLAVVSK